MGRIVNKHILKAARGEGCTLQIPGYCTYNPETTVAAHVNVDGGCMGGKTDDHSVCFADHGCHEAIDRHLIPKEDIIFYTRRGLVRTWKRLIEMGIIKIK